VKFLPNTFLDAEMKNEKLIPVDHDLGRLIDWMEKGEECPELI
jgi:hypothetical protein